MKKNFSLFTFLLSFHAICVTLTSCSDTDGFDTDTPEPFPTGQVIAVDASLSTAGQTRAVGKLFEAGDQLLAYVEAGKKVGDVFTPVVEEDDPDVNKTLYSKLLTFDFAATVAHETEDANTNKSSSFTATSVYYWDDFSTLTYDLRDKDVDRGIRLKYGYCYNGGTPSKGLTEDDHTEADGIIEWTVNQDQKANGTKTSDLLMATTQDMIRYNHSDVSARGTLKMPFTHAMSQFTIEIHCGETFADPSAALANTEIKLHHVQVKCEVNAPTGTITPKKGDGAILAQLPMHPETAAANVKRFTAIVAPTNLTVGNILADITDVNGINYQIDVTDNLLNGGTNKWSTELYPDDEDPQDGVAQSRPITRAGGPTIEKGTGYRTKPGVNYKLVVTVDKQKIDVYATIADWVEVDAETVGKINFTNDITAKGEATSLGDYSWYDVFRATSNSSNAAFDENTSTTNKIDEATYYQKIGTTWSNSPDIYWPNAQESYYFRALGSNYAKQDLYGSLVTTSAVSGIDYITIKNGTQNDNDMIWGTTSAANGYSEGDAIAPRTGDVPLTFSHLLTKVSFKMETSNDGAKAIDLNGAKIQISDVYSECRLTLSTGKTIVAGDKGNLYADNDDSKGRLTVYNATEKTASLANQIVTPQQIADGSLIIITLADGTTYKAQLNQCLVTDENGDATTTEITEWKQGEHYTYTIYLEKEMISFSAAIKEWETKKGSGNATLDWD